MRAGRLRHRITLEQPAPPTPGGVTIDPVTGASTPGWQAVAEVWAAIDPITGREKVAAEQVAAEITHTITIRYRADVRPTWRARRGDRVFDFVALTSPADRPIEMQIQAAEQVGG